MRSRLDGIYYGIRARCLNPNYHAYPKYGGRGIGICDEWRDSFQSFKAWALSNGYASHLSIDRIDGSKGYCPSNCRWATPKEQSRNISHNVWIEIDGRRQILSDWCSEANINPALVLYRLKKGMGYKEAIFTKPFSGKRIVGTTEDGKVLEFPSMAEACRFVGRSPAALTMAIKRNHRCASIKWKYA